MPSTGETKLKQMRLYSKTPAGQAAQQRAQDKRSEKLGTAIKKLKASPQALLTVMANWR